MINIEKLMMLVIVSSIVIFGMFGLANDLSAQTGMTYSDTIKNETQNVMDNIETLSKNMTSTIQGSSSWLETGFTLLFRVPSIIGSLFKVPSIISNMLTVTLGEGGIPIPTWIGGVITVVLGLIIIFSIMALIFKWRV